MQDIKSNTSSDFETVMVAMVTPLAKYDALELFRAFDGLGTDEARTTEILCTRTSNEVAEIKAAYEAERKQTLRARLIDETSGDLQTVYLHMVDGKRGSRDVAADVAHVTKIKNKEPRQAESDQTWLVNLIAGNTRAHVAAVAESYEKATGLTLTEVVQGACSGDVEVALLCLLKSEVTFLAEKLIVAFNKFGVDDDTMIRIMLGQCQRASPGLHALAVEVERLSSKSLQQWIQEKTSGSERQALQMIRANFA